MYQEESFKTQRVVYAHTRSDEGDMEYKMHCHDVYEVYYMISGNAEYLLEGRTYTPRPGSLIIIPPGCWRQKRMGPIIIQNSLMPCMQQTGKLEGTR